MGVHNSAEFCDRVKIKVDSYLIKPVSLHRYTGQSF